MADTKEESRSSRRRRRRRDSKAQEAVQKGNKSDNPVIRYFQNTSEEMQKVKWPTQDEAIRLTIICLVATIISTIVLASFDFLFQQLVRLLVSI